MRYSRQRWGRGFTYRDDNKQIVKDKTLLAFFCTLAIPPAWTDVEINTSKRASIRATGYDAKGRKQYIYSPNFRLRRDRTKFDRILRFASALQKMRGIVQQQLRRRKLDREKVLATMVRLLDIGHFRPGNECYAKENNSFGLTTLRDRHLHIEGSVITFNYQGKSGKMQEKTIVNARLAQIVNEINKLPGYEIFKYIDPDGTVRDVKSQDLNAYIREHMGEEFSAKDFRTWAGTSIAAATLDEYGITDQPNAQQLKNNVRKAIVAVSEALGNTQAIARKSYIDPRVINNYLQGKTLSGCQREAHKLRNKMNNLTVQELALLCLLKNNASPKNKGL